MRYHFYSVTSRRTFGKPDVLSRLSRLDSEGVHTGGLFRSLRSTRSSFPTRRFGATLLCFITSLVHRPLHDQGGDLQRVFTTHTSTSTVGTHVIRLVRRYDTKLIGERNLMRTLSTRFVAHLVDALPSASANVIRHRSFTLRLFSVVLHEALTRSCHIGLSRSRIVSSLIIDLTATGAKVVRAFPCDNTVNVATQTLGTRVSDYC